MEGEDGGCVANIVGGLRDGVDVRRVGSVVQMRKVIWLSPVRCFLYHFSESVWVQRIKSERVAAFVWRERGWGN